MAKTSGIIVLCFLLVVVFVQPVRDYMNAFFHRADFKEERIIGTVSTYNPRVREIQAALSQAGYYDDVLDGLMGERTRVSLRAFQSAQGLNPTGRIDSVTLLALNRIEHRDPAVQSPVVPEEPSAPAGGADTAPGVAEPSGAKPLRSPGGDSRAWGEAGPDDRNRQVQSALKKAGLYNGRIDGKIGNRTVKAIKVFQKTHGLKSDGVVGKATWEKLRRFL